MFAVPPPSGQSTCIFPTCKKPLGQESKDLGFLTCHEHRMCSLCNEELTAREIQYCYDRWRELEQSDASASIDLIHVKCSVTSHKSMSEDPTLSIKQSEYDYLNLIRLMIEPSVELSLVTNEKNAAIQSQRLLEKWNDFDKAYAHLKMLESCVELVSMALSQDKKKLKERADEREKVKFKQAQKQADTSSRPVNKAADDEGEILLAAFMKKNEITSRKVGQQLWRDRVKAISGWVKAGIKESVAQEMVDKEMDYVKKAKDLEALELKK